MRARSALNARAPRRARVARVLASHGRRRYGSSSRRFSWLLDTRWLARPLVSAISMPLALERARQRESRIDRMQSVVRASRRHVEPLRTRGTLCIHLRRFGAVRGASYLQFLPLAPTDERLREASGGRDGVAHRLRTSSRRIRYEEARCHTPSNHPAIACRTRAVRGFARPANRARFRAASRRSRISSSALRRNIDPMPQRQNAIRPATAYERNDDGKPPHRNRNRRDGRHEPHGPRRRRQQIPQR